MLYEYKVEQTDQQNYYFEVIYLSLNSKIQSFEEHFKDGVYAIPKEKGSKGIKVRALLDYCRQEGINPEDLSEKELERFLD